MVQCTQDIRSGGASYRQQRGGADREPLPAPLRLSNQGAGIVPQSTPSSPIGGENGLFWRPPLRPGARPFTLTVQSKSVRSVIVPPDTNDAAVFISAKDTKRWVLASPVPKSKSTDVVSSVHSKSAEYFVGSVPERGASHVTQTPVGLVCVPGGHWVVSVT
jgi:hypothetical protein